MAGLRIAEDVAHLLLEMLRRVFQVARRLLRFRLDLRLVADRVPLIAGRILHVVELALELAQVPLQILRIVPAPLRARDLARLPGDVPPQPRPLASVLRSPQRFPYLNAHRLAQ